MDWTEVAHRGRHIADRGAEYRRAVRDRTVRAQTRPEEIAARFPNSALAMVERVQPILPAARQIRKGMA